jgi:hypothetical protein
MVNKHPPTPDKPPPTLDKPMSTSVEPMPTLDKLSPMAFPLLTTPLAELYLEEPLISSQIAGVNPRMALIDSQQFIGCRE